MPQEMIQMTSEQFRQLMIEAVQAATAGATAANAGAHSDQHKSKGSFTTCSARFGGTRDHEIVEDFITNVETFKDIENITDEDALKGLSLLFYGIASTWWQGVRKEAKTWQDAIALIREHFSPTKPAYQLYQDIFESKQGSETAIDDFVCRKRALLAQLPEGRHDEETEVDMVYGLLNIKYRKHIARHEVKSFRDLLEKGRIIELNDAEAEELKKQHGGLSGKGKKRCTYCNFRGHTQNECRKKKKADAEDADDA